MNAFPTHDYDPQLTDPRERILGGGMELRDWFAGQIVAGFLSDGGQRLVAICVESHPDSPIGDTVALEQITAGLVCKAAYVWADAMMVARAAQ